MKLNQAPDLVLDSEVLAARARFEPIEEPPAPLPIFEEKRLMLRLRSCL